MYERSSNEDQIVDAYIGFETSLIRGGPSSLLNKRGAVLLDNQGLANLDDTKAFLDALRYLRNRIVHDDSTLSEELPIRNYETHESKEYLQQVRWYLAQTIIAYTSILSSPTDSIQKINQTVIDPQVDAVFGKDESILQKIRYILLD